MKDHAVLTVLSDAGAILTDGHFVYNGGRHGSAYVNKDVVYTRTRDTCNLCYSLALRFLPYDVQVVIGPAIGGVILAQWTAYHLSILSGKEVFGIYAKKVQQPQPGKWQALWQAARGILSLRAAQDRDDRFVIRRGYDKIVAGKNVLVTEDILTTGKTSKRVVQAVRAAGGKVVGVAALCNRGGVTDLDVGIVPKLSALVDITLETWAAADCPLCAQNIPVNMEVGHGAAFMKARAGTSG